MVWLFFSDKSMEDRYYTIGKTNCYTSGLKAVSLVGFVVFPCIVCTILFNEYFDKFLMTFLDIGEIGCMSINKYHWIAIVVNLVKQNFLHDAACWCGFVYAGSVSGIPASS